MENFNQIETNILNKIRNVNDRKSFDSVKTEIFGKKGIITELFQKIGSLDQEIIKTPFYSFKEKIFMKE